MSFDRLYSIRPFVFNPFSFNPFQFLSLKEIPQFLTDIECDHLISYAKRLGLEKSPLAKSEHLIDDETSERTFKIWDNNDDGFIEPAEVRSKITEYLSLFACV